MKRHTAVRSLFVLVVVGLVALIAAIPTSAQSDEPLLTIRSIDSRDADDVVLDFIWSGDRSELETLQLTEQDEAVSLEQVEPRPPDSPPMVVVFVVDRSNAMDQSNALVTTREAIVEWAAAAPPSALIGIVGAGDAIEVIQEPTTNRDALARSVERLTPANVDGGAMWSAMRVGAAILRDQPNRQGNLVAVVGSNDTRGGAAPAAARGEVRSSGSVVFVAAYAGDGMNLAPWNQLADMSGGRALATSDGLEIGSLLEAQQSLIDEGQYRLRFASSVAAERAADEAAAVEAAEELGGAVEFVEPQTAEITLSVGGEQASAIVVLGGVATGPSQLMPTVIEPAGGIAFLQGGLGLAIAVLVTLIAGALAAFAVVSLVVKEDGLSSVLQPYADDPLSGGDVEGSRGAFVDRAAQIAEQVADSQGRIGEVEAVLERADMPLRAGEALAFYFGIIVVSTLLGLILSRNLLGGLGLGILAVIVPIAYVKIRATMRQKKFMSQLPDTLQLLSGTLKAGYSLMQGVEAVSTESEDPMGAELRRVVTEARLGRPLEEALEQAAERMDSPDFGWAVMAIRIQREVGGNLAELLMTVADTMIARERLRREVAALTAEGRVSAMVLGVMPLGLMGVMFSLNPDYTGTLFTDTMGNFLLIAAGVMMLVGFIWMRSIIKIEI